MSSNIFEIYLPSLTAKEVVEWFEIMKSSDRLSESLVELVYEAIKTGNQLTSPLQSSSEQQTNIQSDNCASIDQEDFFNSLYNWQDSGNEVFKEEKKPKREMLIV